MPSSLKRSLLLALALYGSSNLPIALGGKVQKPGLQLPPSAAENRDKIKQMFTSAYGTYKQFAFGHDDVKPISRSAGDSRNGWGATIVDSMSTMAVMGLDDLFDEAVEFSSKIDFSRSQTDDTVSVFETTIRYLGGLLSAYQLSGSKHDILVQKAQEVADKMVHAWVGTNNIPFGHMDFTTNQPLVQNTNIAEAGTLSLEWFMLSKLTGNDLYRNLTERSVRQVISLTDPLPSLAAQCVNPATGQFCSGYVTWGGGSDSYFEYLLKYARLTGTSDPIFVNTWREAVDSSIKTLLRTSTVGNHVYLADYDSDRKIRHVSSHLACFHGGNWILGGQLLNNQTLVDIGLQLTDACWNTYESTVTGLGPEAFAFISDDGDFTGGSAPTAADIAFYNQHGFRVNSGRSYYILRPEVLESNFHAWRVTGDLKYQERAAAAAASMRKFLSVNGAFAGISDVRVTNSPKYDDTESFFFAEVLKYLYLTFDDPEHISLDDYVFNTEAHPFIADPVPANFGAGPFNSRPSRPLVVLPGPAPAVSAIPGLPLQFGPISQ